MARCAYLDDRPESSRTRFGPRAACSGCPTGHSRWRVSTGIAGNQAVIKFVTSTRQATSRYEDRKRTHVSKRRLMSIKLAVRHTECPFPDLRIDREY